MPANSTDSFHVVSSYSIIVKQVGVKSRKPVGMGNADLVLILIGQPAGFQNMADALSAMATPVLPIPAPRESGSIWRKGTAVIPTWAFDVKKAPVARNSAVNG